MKICKQCGYCGKEKTIIRGNNGLEIIFWLSALFTAGFMILVALPYSIWRRSGKYNPLCPKCGAPNMIPLDTPVGQKLAEEYGINKK